MPNDGFIRVLIVDDEPDLNDLAKSFLESSAKMGVITASSVAEAKIKLAETRFDAVVSDYQMPREDGIMFLNWLRSSGDSIPFILFTGKGREEVVIEALNSGADSYLQKGGNPLSLYVELEHRIRAAVRRHRAVGDLEQRNRELQKANEELAAAQERMQYNLEQIWAGNIAIANSTVRLRESEVRFDQLAVQSATVIWEADRDGLFTHVSSVSEAVWGYRPDELIGKKHFYDLVADPEGDPVRSMAFEMLKHRNRFVGLEQAILTKDGHSVWNSTSGIPVMDERGNLNGYQGSDTDISERKRAEAVLKNEEEGFHLLFNNHDSVMLLIDGETGLIVDGNISAQRFYGHDRGSLRKLRIEDINMLPPEEVKEHRTSARREQRNRFIFPHRTANGIVRTVEVHSSPICLGGRSILFSIINDVTERQRMEEAMCESEEKFRNLFEMESDALFMIDKSGGQILEANGAAEQLYGYSREEMLRMKNTDLSAQPEETRNAMEGSLTSVPLRRHRKKDGTVFPLEITAKHYVWKGSPVIICAMRDISQRMRVEKALQEASHRLNLLSGITRHDITNQILVLQGQHALLKRELLQPSAGKFLLKAEAAAQRISDMIKFTEEYENIGVKAPIWTSPGRQTEKAFSVLRHEGVVLQDDVPSLLMNADPMVEKVYYNLIENSMAHGGHVTRIRMSTEQKGDAMVLLYEDDGAGISDADRERLFERGYGKHTGFGLFLAREILAITGITINENGRAGQGVRFEMLMPPGAWKYLPEEA